MKEDTVSVPTQILGPNEKIYQKGRHLHEKKYEQPIKMGASLR